LSDVKDDGVRHSQHKLALAKQLANKYVVLNSTSGSAEEEEDDDEIEVEQSTDVESSSPAAISSTARIFFSKFTEMSRKFA
jgi:hypothetical protein